MNNQVIGVEINISGIDVTLVNIETKSAVPGTAVRLTIDTNETAENLIMSWADAIKQSHKLNSSDISLIGVAIPGPFDYENGISLIKNQEKFDSLYNLNIKELLAKQLNISPLNIRIESNTSCFLQGEVLNGTAQGYNNVLGFSLKEGLGSARYVSGVATDVNLGNALFKDGIAEDYLGTKWISKRYEEFTGLNISTIKELTQLAKTDDGIGQLVFNEYSENFVTFLIQYIKLYDCDMVVLGGGYTYAWDLIIRHVKDRLTDKNIYIPIRQAVLGDTAILIGAAGLWN